MQNLVRCSKYWKQPTKNIYQDYIGAEKYGNLFSVDIGPDYEGKTD
jgi:hypothetical protein